MRPALVAISVFDRFTAPRRRRPGAEVLQRGPGAEVRFVGHRTGPVRTENGQLALVADAAFAELPAPDPWSCPAGSSPPPASPPAESDKRV